MKLTKTVSLALSLCLVLLFVSLSFLSGCSNTSGTTPSTTAPSTTSAQSASTIKLKFYTDFPPNSGAAQEAELLAEELSQLSNGRIVMTVYPSEQLGPIDSVLELLKNGITDLAAIGTPRLPTVFPLEAGQEIALSVLPDWVTATNVRNQITLGDFGQAFPKNNLKFLSWNIVRPQQLFLTKKIAKAEDFKGLKIRAANPSIIQFLQPFGMVPVSMPMGDVYESLQRGIIDGVLNAPENVVNNKWYEVTKFYVTNTLAYGGTGMVISESSYNSLPPELQGIFSQAIDQWLPKAIAHFQTIENAAIDTMKAAGVEVYSLDSAESARWIELQAPSIDEWAAKTDAPGTPAKAMVEEIRKSAAK